MNVMGLSIGAFEPLPLTRYWSQFLRPIVRLDTSVDSINSPRQNGFTGDSASDKLKRTAFICLPRLVQTSVAQGLT